MNVEALFVGMKRPSWKGKGDGYLMDYSSDSGLTLYVFFYHPSAAEKKALRPENKFKISFSSFYGIGFFSLKFGVLPWGDCAFSPSLYDVCPEFPDVGNGIGYALNVLFIDSSTGTLLMIRQIGLGSEFSQHFKDWCENSLKSPISREYYLSATNKVYQTFNSAELARHALFSWEL